jgi:hypothetical protein
LANGEKLIIQDDKAFSKWICRILKEFEEHTLNGENGLSTLLWDEPFGKNPQTKRVQKQEEALSDLLYHWFEWRKLKNPIISAREIQIKRKSLRNSDITERSHGKRVDIDCRFRTAEQDARVTLEIKRDVNLDWEMTDSLNQLKEYLETERRSHGVYVIGRWNGFTKTRKEILNILHPQAELLQKEGYYIQPLVLEIG